jgi:hypothetical protein
MHPSLHEAFDDDSGKRELTPARAAELADTRALFDGVLRSIPERPIPDLGASVLQRIEATAQTPRALRMTQPARHQHRFTQWLWSPHRMSVSIRPAYAVAAAAILAVAIGLRGVDRDLRHANAPTAATATAAVLVHFRLDAPQAKSVVLAGDFSNWSPEHRMKRSTDGIWTIVVPLTPGVHEYSFIVDGSRWIPDPAAPPKADGFGGMNSRIAVLGPDRRS